MRKPRRLERPDAVLGGNGPSEGSDKGEHRVLVAPVRGRRGDDVHVHVPVGDVPEGNDPSTGIHGAAGTETSSLAGTPRSLAASECRSRYDHSRARSAAASPTAASRSPI